MPVITSIGAISARAMGVFSDNLLGVIAQPPTIEQNTEIYQWKCPAGVTIVSVIMIAGGGTGGLNYGAGGGGGALAYGNNIPVIPGQIYYVGVGLGGQNVSSQTTAQYGFGGDSYFISPAILNAGGGKPGIAGKGGTPGGGGGAGGYSGAGGNGGAANIGTSTTATKFAGGAGGVPSGQYLSGGGAGGAGGQACTSNYPCDAATAGTGGASGGGSAGFNGSLGGGGTCVDGIGNNGAGSGPTNAGKAGTKTLNGGSLNTQLTGSPAGYDNNTIPSIPGRAITQTIVSGGSSTTYPDPFLNIPLCGGVNTTTAEGGMYGGGGAGTASVYSGGRGIVRIIWGSNRAFPSTNVTDQPITSTTGQINYIAQIGPEPLPNWPVAYNANVTVYMGTTENVISVTYDNPSNLKANLYVTSQPALGSSFMYSNSSVKYTPQINFVGTENFMYLIQNSYGNSFPAMVTVNVINPNVLQTLYLNCVIDASGSKSANYVTGVVTNPGNATLNFNNTDGFLNLFGSNSTSMSACLNWTTFMNYVAVNNLFIDSTVGITLTKSFTITYPGYTAVFDVVINVIQIIPVAPSPTSGCNVISAVFTTNGGAVKTITDSNGTALITGSTAGSSVWGDNVYGYTTDSDFAKAIVHAGLVKAGQTARIKFTGLGSLPGPFPGTTANGVTTSPWSTPWCATLLSLDTPTVTVPGRFYTIGFDKFNSTATFSYTVPINNTSGTPLTFSVADPGVKILAQTNTSVTIAPDWVYIGNNIAPGSQSYPVSIDITYGGNQLIVLLITWVWPNLAGYVSIS